MSFSLLGEELFGFFKGVCGFKSKSDDNTQAGHATSSLKPTKAIDVNVLVPQFQLVQKRSCSSRVSINRTMSKKSLSLERKKRQVKQRLTAGNPLASAPPDDHDGFLFGGFED